jgi:hypothetical protein
MEIQLASFILGICSVLVITMGIISVYVVVKVMRLKDDYKNLSIWVSQEFENLRKERDVHENDTNKAIDSRCDKLYEKIMKDKYPLKMMIGRHPELDNDEFKSGIIKMLDEDNENDLNNRIRELIKKTQ